MFVDDLSVETVAPKVWIIEGVRDLIKRIAKGFKKLGDGAVPDKKPMLGLLEGVGNALCDNWKKDDGILIQVQMNVRPLRTGLGAGRRRNVEYLKQRFKAFKKRGPKYREM